MSSTPNGDFPEKKKRKEASVTKRAKTFDKNKEDQSEAFDPKQGVKRAKTSKKRTEKTSRDVSGADDNETPIDAPSKNGVLR